MSDTLPPHLFHQIMDALSDNSTRGDRNINQVHDAIKALHDWALTTTSGAFRSDGRDFIDLIERQGFGPQDKVVIATVGTTLPWEPPTQRIAWNKYIDLSGEFDSHVKVQSLQEYLKGIEEDAS